MWRQITEKLNDGEIKMSVITFIDIDNMDTYYYVALKKTPSK